MNTGNSEEDRIGFDLGEAIGAKGGGKSFQRIAIYLPDRDQNNNVIAVEPFVEVGMQTLVDTLGGVTCLSKARGRFKTKNLDQNGRPKITTEETYVIYSFIFKSANFEQIAKTAIRDFIHEFGRMTNQEEVMVEYSGEGSDGTFYSRAYYVSNYDTVKDVDPV